jgi:ribosome-binding protein 1
VTSNESDVSEETSSETRSEPATPPEVPRKQAPKAQAAAGKKGKGKGGILINKNEPVMVKEVESVEEVNHFVEIHPKDAVEIHRGKEEEKSVKNFRENKKSHKQQQQQQQAKETPPVSPKNQPAPKEVKIVEEKNVKKKRSEPLATSAVPLATKTIVEANSLRFVTDETGITPLIRELSRADMTKNQIQVLIDFLLNKQSDTTARDPTEWSEGKSDVNQKLKKQLQEKEAQLKNEQDALAGMQIKLKELRAEINTEKIQGNATLKAQVEQIQNCKAEIKTLQSEIQFLNDKHNNEKQTLNNSLKQMQTKLLQVTETLKAQESLPNIQQIQSENQSLQQEIVSKNQQIMELNVAIDQKEVRKFAIYDIMRALVNSFYAFHLCRSH